MSIKNRLVLVYSKNDMITHLKQVSDPFGHSWSLATHKEDVPRREMAKRAQETMAKMGQQAQSAS